ncbi:MAG: RNA polymerase sigma factor [Bacillota bacterium]
MGVQADRSQRREGRRAEPLGGAERELLERARRGDREAFAGLIGRYEDRVARLAWRLLGWRGEVEDVVQEVFIAAMLNLRKFRGESSFGTWLMALTVNRCRREQRKRRLRWMLWGRWGKEVEGGEEQAADEPVLTQERSERVRRAVRGLPARYREVIVLRYIEQMSIEEIMGVLHLSRSAVEVRLHRGREQLREVLGEMMKE